MMDIRYYGDPVLSQNSFEYVIDTESGLDHMKQVVDDMYRTMHRNGGIGLAANQVGLPFPLFVWDFEDTLGVAINPTIRVPVDHEGPLVSYREGCLSAPGYEVNVARATECILNATNMSGEKFEIHAKGKLATVFQHEMDHLFGYCIVDHLNREQRRAVKKAMKKL